MLVFISQQFAFTGKGSNPNLLVVRRAAYICSSFSFFFFCQALTDKTTMATLKRPDGSVALSQYRDQHFKGSRHEQEKALLKSTTLYVGNLSYFTSEEQIHELFSRAGDVKRIVMGLDKVRKTPCGFCFVEYYARIDAENCMR